MHHRLRLIAGSGTSCGKCVTTGLAWGVVDTSYAMIVGNQ
jgi:hypothetical protein